MRDVRDDFLIPFRAVNRSQRYRDLESGIDGSVHTIVGHSLGAAVALDWAKRHPNSVHVRTYGAPTISGPSGGGDRHRDWFDPVSMFDTGAEREFRWTPHSLKQSAYRSG